MTVSAPLRIIDTGLNAGRWNIAADQALIDEHRAGRTPDTLRILTFTPSVLVGRHQDLSREIDVDYCRAHGIDIGRRITGGGAIYLDPGQLGWELICSRTRLGGGSLTAITERICEAAAVAMSELGVEVRFRPRNDLEVDGRKIGGTGGFFDGETVFYQGTLLIDADTETMFRVLRVPPAKRARQAQAAAASRVTTLRAQLGRALPSLERIRAVLGEGLVEQLGFDYEHGALNDVERSAIEDCHANDIGSDEFVYEIDGVHNARGWRHASADTRGGLVEVYLTFGTQGDPRVENAIIVGDYFVTPPRMIYDLEAALRGARASEAGDCARDFLAARQFETLSIEPAELAGLVERAARAEEDRTWTTSRA